MAPKEEPKSSIKEEVVRVISTRTVDERVSGLISEQRDFPDPASIELHEPFVDVFQPPKWADTKLYAYGWVDPSDEVQLDRAINHDYWNIVTRSNHSGATNSDFRNHGAVERRGMILVYRPIELEQRLRFLGVKRHKDMMGAQLEPKKGHKWERNMEVGEDVPAPGFKPFAAETAGSPVVKAEDIPLEI